MLSITEEIARGDHCVTRYLSFKDQVALMDERILETVSKVIDSRCTWRCTSKDVREEWRRRITRLNVGGSWAHCTSSSCGTNRWDLADCLTGTETSVDQ